MVVASATAYSNAGLPALIDLMLIRQLRRAGLAQQCASCAALRTPTKKAKQVCQIHRCAARHVLTYSKERQIEPPKRIVAAATAHTPSHLPSALRRSAQESLRSSMRKAERGTSGCCGTRITPRLCNSISRHAKARSPGGDQAKRDGMRRSGRAAAGAAAALTVADQHRSSPGKSPADVHHSAAADQPSARSPLPRVQLRRQWLEAMAFRYLHTTEFIDGSIGGACTPSAGARPAATPSLRGERIS